MKNALVTKVERRMVDQCTLLLCIQWHNSPAGFHVARGHRPHTFASSLVAYAQLRWTVMCATGGVALAPGLVLAAFSIVEGNCPPSVSWVYRDSVGQPIVLLLLQPCSSISDSAFKPCRWMAWLVEQPQRRIPCKKGSCPVRIPRRPREYTLCALRSSLPRRASCIGVRRTDSSGAKSEFA